MARAPVSVSDPSIDAAALLRRLGLVVLMIGVPGAAVVARRGIVLMVPIGISLLVLAVLLDGKGRRLRDMLGQMSGSPGSVALVLGIVWAGVSLLWAPMAAQAVERYVSMLSTLGVALLGYLALPDRMRSANLYLLPVGVALAALGALVFTMGWGSGSADFDEDGQSLGRGLTVIILFVWPAIAWLRSRERDLEAFGLGVLVATASVVIAGRTPLPLILAVGAVVYAVSSVWPRAAATATAFVMSALILLAPMFLFLVSREASLVGRFSPWFDSVPVWNAILAGDPARLVTGHGFAAFLSARATGLMPFGTLGSAVIQIWYDLGLVGALTAAAALWAGPRAAVTSYAPLSSGVTSAYATAFALALIGIGTGQMWLLTVFSILTLAFVASERGQFRTERPRASLFRSNRETVRP
jgi:hypothetical protein